MRDYQIKSNEGGLSDSITATKLGAGELNSVLTEAKTAVSSSGQTLAVAAGTSETLDQLSMALAIYGAGGAGYCIDTGAVNSYVVNPVSPKKAIPAYFDGMTITFTPGTVNTGASTVNYNSLGAKDIVNLWGDALSGGELSKFVTIKYNSGSDYFEIVSTSTGYPIAADVTYTVGSGGDYATINEALEDLSQFSPVYRVAGVTVTLNLLAGFVMAEQVLVYGIDFGWITITGADSETSITHTALTTEFANSTYPAFGVTEGGTLPIINQLFRMSSGATVGSNKHGVYSHGAGSGAVILAGAGVQDAGTYGLVTTHNASASAGYSNFSGAGLHCIFAAHSSTIDAMGADASGAGEACIYAVDCSCINAANADAYNAGTHGVVAQSASSINAYGVDATTATVNGIYAYDNSNINATNADASGAGSSGIVAQSSSSVNAYNAKASNATQDGIHAEQCSTINARVATVLNCGQNGVVSFMSSSVNAYGANVDGSTTYDYAVGDSGIIDSSDYAGSTPTYSKTLNTWTAEGWIGQ